MFATAKYESDDLRVSFVCQMERADYGVPRSPSWWEPVSETAEIDELEILGVSVDAAALPKDLRDAIYGLSVDLDWEGEIE
jgi:hypothetical protein